MGGLWGHGGAIGAAMGPWGGYGAIGAAMGPRGRPHADPGVAFRLRLPHAGVALNLRRAALPQRVQVVLADSAAQGGATGAVGGSGGQWGAVGHNAAQWDGNGTQ